MPQPLSRVLPTASVLIANGGDRVLSRHPELAVQAMEAIGSWSNVESFLIGLYVELMGGPNELASTAYLSLETQSAKTQAIQAVARKSLSKENLRLLNAILAVAKTHQKSRDKLAHHVWGESPDIPDALLLADPKALVGNDFVYDDIYVYRAKDFSSIITANDRLCGYGLQFRFILMGHVANRDGRLYDRLCAEPEIQERLGRLA